MNRNGHIGLRREIRAGEGATDGVVMAVSEMLEVDPITLDPLTRTVDADALDALYESMGPEGRISFQYADCEVTVTGDGMVEVASCESQ